MTKEIPANTTATLNKAVGNASAALLLSRIVYWNTRKKGGVEYQGRLWSFRSQKDWIEQEAGLRLRTGKMAWARLVDDGFILAEMRWGGPHGNRQFRMHVALTDKTISLLDEAGVPHLQMPMMLADQKLKEHAEKEKLAAWAAKAKADYPAGILAAETSAAEPKKMTWEEISAHLDNAAD